MSYVDAVVAVSVIRVLLFVLHVCMLRECEGARVTVMMMCGYGGCVGVVSAWYVGGTCGSGIVSRASDVLGMRGVGGVCLICMCLAQSGLGASE